MWFYQKSQDAYWNKFRKNEVGSHNAMNNYFESQKYKLKENFIPSSPKYESIRFVQDFEINVLRKVVYGKALTQREKIVLQKTVKLKGMPQISLKKLFSYYLCFLGKTQKLNAMEENSFALKKLIKQFLLIVKKIELSGESEEIKGDKEEAIIFDIFQTFTKNKAQRTILQQKDKGQLYETLFKDHVQLFSHKDKMKNGNFFAPLNLQEQTEDKEVKKEEKKSKKRGSTKKKFHEFEEKIPQFNTQSLSFELELLRDRADKILFDKK